MDAYSLHCSQLTDWTVCEKSKVWRTANPTGMVPREEHVATWIGTAVHAAVAGQGIPAPPPALVFDGETPTLRHARVQIERIAEAVIWKLRQSGWTIIAYEVELEPLVHADFPWFRVVGRIDLLVLWQGGIGILDIKTSKAIEPAWVQLGGYGVLYEEGPHDRPLEHLGTVWCPRTHIARDQKDAQIIYCEARDAMHEARRIMRRVASLLEHDTAVASPGHNCGWCEHPTCVVRTVAPTLKPRETDL